MRIVGNQNLCITVTFWAILSVFVWWRSTKVKYNNKVLAHQISFWANVERFYVMMLNSQLEAPIHFQSESANKHWGQIQTNASQLDISHSKSRFELLVIFFMCRKEAIASLVFVPCKRKTWPQETFEATWKRAELPHRGATKWKMSLLSLKKWRSKTAQA